MAKIKFGDLQYRYEDLTGKAQSHLAALEFIESELHKLKGDITVYQTAREVHLTALRAELRSTMSLG